MRSAESGAPELRVLSREEAERYEPEGEYEVCISISSTPQNRAELSPRFREVLHMAFADIDPPRLRPPGVPDPEPFAEQHAREALEFARRHAGAERIVVHCRAGESRSPAVALGLMDALGIEPGRERWERWRHHNRLVRTRLVRLVREGAPGSGG